MKYSDNKYLCRLTATSYNPLTTIKHINMYEEFLEKSLNNKRQAVDDTFIAKYADLSYPELNILWQEVGLGCYCNGLFKLINPSYYQDGINT